MTKTPVEGSSRGYADTVTRHMGPGEVASTEPSGEVSSPTLPERNEDEVYWFTEWDEGVRHNVREKRWAGLLGMIKTSPLGPERDGKRPQPLLEQAFCETIETLRPSDPRKELVMNAFIALSTWGRLSPGFTSGR
jgi:hypothetical protein